MQILNKSRRAMPTKPPANPKHLRFAEFYLAGDSLVDSYLKAGFVCPRTSAKASASRLIRHPDVAAFVAASMSPPTGPSFQPPDTAPKDGTMILAAFGGADYVPSVWDGTSKRWATSTIRETALPNGAVRRRWSWELEAAENLTGWIPWPEMAGRPA